MKENAQFIRGIAMARKSKTTDIVKKFPSSENGVSISVKDVVNKEFKISHNLKTGKFTLWEIVNEGFKQIAIGNSPYELYEFIDFGDIDMFDE